MNQEPLSQRELEMIQHVLGKHPEITVAKLFGSRAKGTHAPHSDIDLAIWGTKDTRQAGLLAGELDELPLPYHFDVLSFELIQSAPLREHVERVGVTVYPS